MDEYPKQLVEVEALLEAHRLTAYHADNPTEATKQIEQCILDRVNWLQCFEQDYRRGQKQGPVEQPSKEAADVIRCGVCSTQPTYGEGLMFRCECGVLTITEERLEDCHDRDKISGVTPDYDITD